MGLEIEATYENGVLIPDQELAFENGQRVKLTLRTPGSAVERLYGKIPLPNDVEEVHRFLDDPDEGQWGAHDV